MDLSLLRGFAAGVEEWEQSVLYPRATEQIVMDLDDGVKTNYPKFGVALITKYTGF